MNFRHKLDNLCENMNPQSYKSARGQRSIISFIFKKYIMLLKSNSLLISSQEFIVYILRCFLAVCSVTQSQMLMALLQTLQKKICHLCDFIPRKKTFEKVASVEILKYFPVMSKHRSAWKSYVSPKHRTLPSLARPALAPFL